MNVSQKMECIDLQSKLIHFMKNQLNRRSKAIVISVNECVTTLITLFAPSNIEWIYKYSISKDIYDTMIEKAKQFIQRKCEKGIDSDRIINKNNTTWHRLQNYYLHNAPEISTDFYIIILTKIAEYFDYISPKMDEICIGINQDEIRQFLKKKFILNLMTAPLQQHRQSNAKGPIIQYAAWKQVKMQEIISNHFDDLYDNEWDEWMQLNEKNGELKAMRIGTMINKKIKPFARKSLKEFIEKLGIKIEIKDFKIGQQEIEKFELFSRSNIMNQENNENDQFEASQNSSNNDLSFQSTTFSGYDDKYRYDQHPSFEPSYNSSSISTSPLSQDTNYRNYAPSRGTRNTVKTLRNSPMECAENERIKFLQKENDKLLKEINGLHQLLDRINDQSVSLNTFSRNYAVSDQDNYSNNNNNINSRINSQIHSNQQFDDKCSNQNHRIHQISLSPDPIQRNEIIDFLSNNNNNNNYQQHIPCCFNDQFPSNVGHTFHEINDDQQAMNQNFVYH